MEIEECSSDIPTVLTGEELEELPKVTWRWVVHEYSRLVEGKPPGVVEESPAFVRLGYEMRICLYPSGHSASSTENVGLFFDVKRVSSGPEVPCRFQGELVLLDPVDMTRRHVARHKHRHPVPSRHGWAKFCLRVKLQELSAASDRLAIEASVTFFESKRHRLSWSPKPSLAADMRRLLDECLRADVVFIIGGRTFRAHRCVLAVRAPALASLADNREDGSSEPVPLSDKLDPAAFAKVLEFAYTDKADDAELQARPEMYLRMANFCGCVRLKQLAELNLAKRLSVDTAADSFLLADALDCAHLREVAVDTILANLAAVAATPGWQRLRKAAHLIADILESAAAASTDSYSHASRLFPNGHHPPAKRRRVADLRQCCEDLDLETDGSKEVLERRLATRLGSG